VWASHPTSQARNVFDKTSVQTVDFYVDTSKPDVELNGLEKNGLTGLMLHSEVCRPPHTTCCSPLPKSLLLALCCFYCTPAFFSVS
jgi:hypothetical protein